VKRIGPRVYYDQAQDSLHIVADELLEASGYAPTPTNMATVRRVAHELLAEEFPGVPVREEGFE